MNLLTVRELSVSFETRDGKVRAVNDVTFSLEAWKVEGARAPGRIGLREELRKGVTFHDGSPFNSPCWGWPLQSRWSPHNTARPSGGAPPQP